MSSPRIYLFFSWPIFAFMHFTSKASWYKTRCMVYCVGKVSWIRLGFCSQWLASSRGVDIYNKNNGVCDKRYASDTNQMLCECKGRRESHLAEVLSQEVRSQEGVWL